MVLFVGTCASTSALPYNILNIQMAFYRIIPVDRRVHETNNDRMPLTTDLACQRGLAARYNPDMHIGINAHLLSGTAGYRSAGIHHYIENTLRHLPACIPQDWQLSVLVGDQYAGQFDGLTLRRSRLNTESPIKRILWEQAIQPFNLRGLDGYHAMAFVAPLILSPPIVVTLYDLSFIHYPERLPKARRLYLERFTRLTCQRARRVIAISQATAQDAIATLGVSADRVDVAAPGFDSGRFHPLPAEQIAAFRKANDLPERFWLFIGTLEPRKNLVTLLEGYAALPVSERLPLIIGGGKGWDYEPIFEAVARYQLEPFVRFTGFIPADDLPLWYNSAESFIYPSVFEGFGLPVLEAMSSGTPVIVSHASSLIELAEPCGQLVDPHDPAAWRDALRMAGGDPAWREIARQRGLEQAQRYQWVDTARQTILSYQRAFLNE
jgi:glycosyltransferase involved in cell wall biosynthesis